jgi:DNA-binding PadR family transcriptional regulator
MFAQSACRPFGMPRLLLRALLGGFAFHHGYGRGHGGPWGGRGFGRGFGPPFGGRRFGRGDLKYVILDLLQEQGPRHGYDIIRALEDRFHGFYSPSPGSVYPTLQLLEDQGFVTSSQQDGKRVYVITDEGRAFLKERADTVEDIRSRMGAGWGMKGSPELRGLIDEVRRLGQFVFSQGAHGGLADSDKVRRLHDVVARARAEVEAIFKGPDITV